MAATTLTLGTPTHATLGATMTAFKLPEGTKAIWLYVSGGNVTFEFSATDNDGNAVAADAYFTWPDGKHGAFELSKANAVSYNDDDLYIGLAGSGFDVEICALADGI